MVTSSNHNNPTYNKTEIFTIWKEGHSTLHYGFYSCKGKYSTDNQIVRISIMVISLQLAYYSDFKDVCLNRINFIYGYHEHFDELKDLIKNKFEIKH